MRGRWSSRAAVLLTAVLGLVSVPLVVAAPAQALDACTTRTLSKPFSQWGDTNDYFAVTSGGFESTSGWTYGSGVTRVAENEPWHVSGNGSYSLKIPAGATATAPEMCVTSTEDSMRFFAKGPAGSGPTLVMNMKVTNTSTRQVWNGSFTFYMTSGSGWIAMPRIQLPNLTGTTGTDNVAISFTSQGATWQIDDVYVDPSRTR